MKVFTAFLALTQQIVFAYGDTGISYPNREERVAGVEVSNQEVYRESRTFIETTVPSLSTQKYKKRYREVRGPNRFQILLMREVNSFARLTILGRSELSQPNHETVTLLRFENLENPVQEQAAPRRVFADFTTDGKTIDEIRYEKVRRYRRSDSVEYKWHGLKLNSGSCDIIRSLKVSFPKQYDMDLALNHLDEDGNVKYDPEVSLYEKDTSEVGDADEFSSIEDFENDFYMEPMALCNLFFPNPAALVVGDGNSDKSVVGIGQ